MMMIMRAPTVYLLHAVVVPVVHLLIEGVMIEALVVEAFRGGEGVEVGLIWWLLVRVVDWSLVRVGMISQIS